MDVDKAIQDANERERKEWAFVRWGIRAIWLAGCLYMVWMLIDGGWQGFVHVWQNLFG